MENSKNFYKLDTKANPHAFSPYPKNVELKKTDKKVPHYSQDYPTYTDIETGDRYVEKLEKFSPPKLEKDSRMERFVVLLIKGILKSSDVIEKKGQFFSKVIDIDKTPRSEKGELFADLFILENLFGDADHIKDLNKEKALFKAQQTGLHKKDTEEYSNLIVKKEKFVHFDYGATNLTPLKYMIDGNKNINLTIGKNIKTELDYFSKNKKIQLLALEQCILKMTNIKERLLDEKFFDSIIQESKVQLELENPREYFIKKTNILLSFLEDLNNKYI